MFQDNELQQKTVFAADSSVLLIYGESLKRPGTIEARVRLIDFENEAWVYRDTHPEIYRKAS